MKIIREMTIKISTIDLGFETPSNDRLGTLAQKAEQERDTCDKDIEVTVIVTWKNREYVLGVDETYEGLISRILNS